VANQAYPQHGVEEVVGSIRIRSTKYFHHLSASNRLAAFGQQISKCLRIGFRYFFAAPPSGAITLL
jgi:hypothetical protein